MCFAASRSRVQFPHFLCEVCVRAGSLYTLEHLPCRVRHSRRSEVVNEGLGMRDGGITVCDSSVLIAQLPVMSHFFVVQTN